MKSSSLGTRQSSLRSSPLTLLNVTCLDAPVVALVWQEVLASARHVHLAGASRLALFATAWLIYLADRLADSFTIPANTPTSLRQRFVRSHRRFFAGAIFCAALIDAIAIPRLTKQVIIAGVMIAAVAFLYLAFNHFFSRVWRSVPLKEIAIGLLFAAGVGSSFASVADVPFGWIPPLFAVLCALNCISIAFWEMDLDLAQRRNSLATVFPEWNRMPLIGCLALTLTAGVCLVATPVPWVMVCIAFSSGLLALLNTSFLALALDLRTALADIVLLTPLLALPFQ